MVGKRILAGLLLPYVGWLVFAYDYHFIDFVNLAFHEAGHLFLTPLGQTAHVLGGSLAQLFFPAACAVHFLRREQRFEAWVCGLWLAESGMYVAWYMADAQAMALPLVGGGEIHDWNWLLSSWGLLPHTPRLAGACHGLASLGALVCWLRLARLAFRAEPSATSPALPLAS